MRGSGRGAAAWRRRRLDPASPLGLPLTVTAAAGLLAAAAFGWLAHAVTAHDWPASADPRVTAWVVAHRAGWLTGIMKAVTWLGSTAVIIPLGLIAGGFFVLRRREWRPLALLATAVAGAVFLYGIVKRLVGRSRPPHGIWIGHFDGFAFPSGHATQSVAFYATLAVVLTLGRPARARAAAWGCATLVVLVVGASRIYLGAHWLTDVLGGYALGTVWAAIVMIFALAASSRGRVKHDDARPGHAGRGAGI
jgi:undecaprenyl-diphosphatase